MSSAHQATYKYSQLVLRSVLLSLFFSERLPHGATLREGLVVHPLDAYLFTPTPSMSNCSVAAKPSTSNITEIVWLKSPVSNGRIFNARVFFSPFKISIGRVGIGSSN